MTGTYLVPSNTGLCSTDRAVAARLRRLLNALSDEITSHVTADGYGKDTLAEDVRQFRHKIIKRLTAEGWTITYAPAGKLRVLAPKRGRS